MAYGLHDFDMTNRVKIRVNCDGVHRLCRPVEKLCGRLSITKIIGNATDNEHCQKLVCSLFER